MKKFFVLILVAFLAVFLGCDDGLEVVDVLGIVDDVVSEQSEESAFGKNSVEFYSLDALSELQWAFERIDIYFSSDPSGEPTGWDTVNQIRIGRPSVLVIPIWILDPERNCMLRSEFTENPEFIEPYQAEIFNWHTGEPYRFHKPRWDGQLPEPIIKKFRNVHTNKDTCPRKWFYMVTLPIYLKYVEGDDKTSKELGLTAEEIGIRIEFENGEKFTWNLSEIYPELPPMPPFRWFEDGEL